VKLTRLGLLPLWFCSTRPAAGQEWIAVVKQVVTASLDSTLPAIPFESWLADVAGIPVSAINWEINDCGEGGDGREAPTCVEAILRLNGDTTAHASIFVTDIKGMHVTPGIWDLSVGAGNHFTGFKTLHEWTAFVRAHHR